MMDGLFDKRVIIVAGKGGTGKTTLTCSLAMAAAEENKSVLVVETQENDALGPLFGIESLGDKPTLLKKNIHGARVDPRQVLKEYVRKFVALPFLAYQITGSSIFEHVAAATPGLKEVMTLAQIWRFERKKKSSSEQPLYDVIIVDSPATGHGLSLLRVPATLNSMLQTGPIADQTRWVNELLRDHERTSLIVATLPEELPVNETLEFCRKAENDLEMHVAGIVVNMVYPVLFDPDEIKSIEWAEEPGSEGGRALLRAAKRQIGRRRLQESHMERLLEEGEQQVVRIPYFYTNTLDSDQIADISRRLRAEVSRSKES
jgi:anion-transporting  ArsA/GET3 family ATPase